MANDLSGKVWTIDSVMAQPYTANVRIEDYIYSDQAVAGDRIRVQDLAGRIIIDLRAGVPNDNVKGAKLGWVQGFQVIQIDSGVLKVSV